MALHLFIASARSGSSRLGQIISSLGLYFIPEPFHPNCGSWGFLGNYQLIAKEALGLSDSLLSPDQLRKTATVLRILEYLNESTKTFVLEIFPEHLEIALVRQLVSLYPVIILQRRLIDQYISLMKAYAVCKDGKWAAVDTTDVKIRICANAFCDYAASMKDFYLNVVSSISPRNSLSSLIVDYEYFSCFESDSQVRLVADLLGQAGISVHQGIKPPDPAVDLHGLSFPGDLAQQDKSPSWYQKVSNPREFASSLGRLSRSSLHSCPHCIFPSVRALSVMDIVSLPFSITSTCCA